MIIAFSHILYVCGYIYTYIYTHTYIYVCVYVCVCVWTYFKMCFLESRKCSYTVNQSKIKPRLTATIAIIIIIIQNNLVNNHAVKIWLPFPRYPSNLISLPIKPHTVVYKEITTSWESLGLMRAWWETDCHQTPLTLYSHNTIPNYIYIYISGVEMGLVLLVPGTTNNSVNVIQNGLKVIH